MPASPSIGTPARHQVCNVAIDGAFRNLEFFSQVARPRKLALAHELDDFEQAVSAAHGVINLQWEPVLPSGTAATNKPPLLTSCCQQP
jgi:hypothetical protein